MKVLLPALIGLASLACSTAQAPEAPPPSAESKAVRSASDTLSSWNDGPAKRAIVDFVDRVAKEGGPDFVPIGETTGRCGPRSRYRSSSSLRSIG